MIFYTFNEKRSKNKKSQGDLKRGSRLKSTRKYENSTKTIAAVFPRGPKRRNPTMTTSTVTARRKGDPQHYVEGKQQLCEIPRITETILHMSFGLPGHLRTTFELTKIKKMRKKYTRCGYTNATCL